MGIVILLMVANIGLFIRMNELQSQVLTSLGPLQAMRVPEGIGDRGEASRLCPARR